MSAPKQKRSRDRVQPILDAALRCFRAEGFRRASVLAAVTEGLMLRESLDPAHKPETLAPYVRHMPLSILSAQSGRQSIKHSVFN